ncbi:cytochrome P450 [Nocardioides litoris]|uniref:cytochrome P450 n=1 Tax=Nocardioides litoris TaxID=1926648 RepID=UPI001B862187|nr:cytochrome P450 [Nocardioides litoris]
MSTAPHGGRGAPSGARLETTARRRDRRVYTASHPVLFRLLSVTGRAPVRRLGSRVVVSGEDEVRQVLTRVPLDRTDDRTTGGAIRKHEGEGALFDETGPAHRASRRGLAERLGSRGVLELARHYRPPIDDAVDALRAGEEVDVCALADAVSGRTVAALLDLDLSPAECAELARAARLTASSAAAAELPSWRRARYRDHLADAFGGRVDPLGKMLALAAVTTTYAALPRAVAWVADEGWWATCRDDALLPVLVDELLRVLAPTPLLPRVAAEPAIVGGVRVTPDDQLLLMVRHAVDAHRRDPSVTDPAPTAQARLVFGAGPHACPGAALARAQLATTLSSLALQPARVVRAVPDRHAALPAWRELVVRRVDRGADR